MNLLFSTCKLHECAYIIIIRNGHYISIPNVVGTLATVSEYTTAHRLVQNSGVGLAFRI